MPSKKAFSLVVSGTLRLTSTSHCAHWSEALQTHLKWSSKRLEWHNIHSKQSERWFRRVASAVQNNEVVVLCTTRQI